MREVVDVTILKDGDTPLAVVMIRTETSRIDYLIGFN
jgi:hypothetical protein